MALVESRYFPDESPWGLFRQARCSHVEALGGPGAGFHTEGRCTGGTGSRVSYGAGFHTEGRGTGGTGSRVSYRGAWYWGGGSRVSYRGAWHWGTGCRILYRGAWHWGDWEQGFIQKGMALGDRVRVLHRGVALGVPGTGFPIQKGVALGDWVQGFIEGRGTGIFPPNKLKIIVILAHNTKCISHSAAV